MKMKGPELQIKSKALVTGKFCFMNWKLLLRRNPLVDWFKWCKLKYSIERKFDNIHVGYCSQIIDCKFTSFNYIGEYAILTNVELGNYSYIGGHSVVHNATFGKYCSVASGCMIGLGIHPTNYISTHPVFYTRREPFWNSVVKSPQIDEYKPIKIGHDVWIGTNAIIRDGVEIGIGSVIAAGAVVTHDVPPYAIVGGVPAKVLRYRFDEETITKLLNSMWWDLVPTTLQKLTTWDVELFLQQMNSKNE